jgi:Flp pilus assembly protein TadD
VLSNGCANSPEKASTSEKNVSPVKIVDKKEKIQSKEIETEISPDVMFMLMTAEIAGQRGQYDIAMEGYLESAKRVNDARLAERAAMIALYIKDNANANEAIKLWLRQDPHSPAARKIAALSALRMGDKRASVEHLAVLLTTDPAGFEKTVLELLAVLQKEDKKTDKTAFVYEVLEELASKKPDQATVYFLQALLAVQMDNKVLAEKKVQQALVVQPNWNNALIFQAQMAVFDDDLNKAKAILKKAALNAPTDEKIKKILAQVLIKASDYTAAAEVYQDIVATNPKDVESQFAYGLVLLQLDKDDQAEAIFKQLLEDSQWHYQASFYLGKIEEKHDNVQKALAWFDKVSDGAFVFESSLSAVVLLAKNKQFDAASSRLDLLETKFPSQKLRVILVKSELYSQQKRYADAFKLLSAALIEAPDEKDLLYTHALMAERVGRLDILERDLKKLLAKSPDNAEALNALGYTLVGNPSRYAEAEKYLQQALKLQPNEAVIMDSYGWLQFKMGRPLKALDYLQRAYAKQKESEIAAHLAEVLWALDRKNEAEQVFNEALKEAPDDENLLDFQRRILNKVR